MNKLPRHVMWGVAVAVMLLFAGGLVLAAVYSLSTPAAPSRMPAVATFVVSSVNGILAANLGAILGVTAILGFRSTLTDPERLQWVAAAFYVITLVLVMVVWGFTGFDEGPEQIVAAIPEVGRTGIGVLLAVFAASLGIQGAARARTRMPHS